MPDSHKFENEMRDSGITSKNWVKKIGSGKPNGHITETFRRKKLGLKKYRAKQI